MKSKPDSSSVWHRVRAALSPAARARPPRGGRFRKGTPQGDWRHAVRRRLLTGAVVFAMWAVGIEARLVYLQVLEHPTLVERAARQQNRSITAHPKRGEILDREGRVLAYSVDADTIYAVPTDIDDPDETAALLCEALDECSPEFKAKISGRLRRPRGFEYVQRQVSPEAARRVAALELRGIGFLKENRRYYPNKDLAAHVLGYVGIDNQGLSGIESTYDTDIRGRSGKMLIQTDARRRAFSRVERPPTTGATVQLTIDKYLQHIAERELRIGVRRHGADGGSVVILDPRTGDVLAMANEPTFNPNVFADAPASARRNRAIQDVYEPGSVFKIVTSAAALEEGVVARDELFDVSAGAIRVGRSVVRDMHTYGVLSFDDLIVKSSNVGAIKIGLRLGPERLSRYVRRFGFGQSLSRDFPAESPGLVTSPARLTDRGVASVSIGYEVAVTPLQMAAAASAVANGGELLEPKVVRAVIRNGIRAETPRRVIRTAISPETAAELTSIMEAVVERGTARAAQVPGYTVAGKTGTAEKLIDGRYSNVDHNASFVGFVPSRQPVLTISVMIDTPRDGVYTGGAVAAPVFQRVAEAALRHLAVTPTVNPLPPILVTPSPQPRVALTSTRSRPSAVLLAGAEASAGPGLMPDLRGMSAREAVGALGPLGLTTRLQGVGFVRDHEPGPGAAVDRGMAATLWLERQTGARPDSSP